MSAEVRAAILALDGQAAWGPVEDAREALVSFGRDIFPEAVELYPVLRSFRARASLVYTCMKFALVEEDAVQLGLLALEDRSAQVIHYACMLLAISGRVDALDRIEVLLTHKSKGVRADATAAIAAIREANRHLFVDRERTSQVTINIAGLIEPTP